MPVPEELRTLRRRLDDLQDRVDAVLAPDPGGSAAFVGQIVQVQKAPGSGRIFVAITPVDISGPEVEGGAATLTPQPVTAQVSFALNIGSGTPKVGDPVLVTKDQGFWVIDYG